MGERETGKKYSGAPYNFIKLMDHVVEKYEDISQIPAHDKINDELLSGEIEYTITPETEIFIGDYTGNSFYRSASGKLAIPGSSFRGLIRNNVQILGQGSIGDDIDDYRIMFRQVAGTDKKLKDYYNKILGVVKSKSFTNADGKSGTVSVCENVKAGYLEKCGSEYVIYGTVDSEKDIDDRNYFYFRCTNLDKICPEGLKYSDGRPVVTNISSPSYIPFSVEISYNTEKKRIVALGAPGKYSLKGYLVGSGPMNKKKALYVVPQINRDICLNVSEESVVSFRRDYEMKKKLLGATVKNISDKDKENFKEYFNLPSEGTVKPVFYIENNGTTYFGFTPYLRLFYKYSIVDGLPDEHKPTVKNEQPRWDYAKSMFGFSKGNVSFKSRVYFTDAEYEGGQKTIERKLVLGEPKPSSYFDYIEAIDKKAANYNDEGFRIRGYKQYWLRDSVKPETVSGAEVKENVGTKFESLAGKQGKFTGVIRFKNLYPDELGLLLHAVNIGENYSYNIGKGKPYGLGRIKTDIVRLRTFDNTKMYSTDSLSFEPFTEYTKEEINNFVKIFADTLKESGNDQKKTNKNNSDFKMMKDTNKLPPVEKIRYMDINKKEYQSRSDDSILPSVAKIIKGDNTPASPDNKDTKPVNGGLPSWMTIKKGR